MCGYLTIMTDWKTVWEGIKPDAEKELNSIASGYLEFLKNAKTESEAVDFFVNALSRNNFSDLEKMERLEPGSRFYINHTGRALGAGIIGKKGIENGLFMIASHIDSPRLDLKPKPLYEDEETNTTLLKTQYYGGVKKYQWVNHPLALHGRVYTKDGKEIKLRIGEEKGDPVFLIPDLLPHLAKMQQERKLFEGVTAEELNPVFSSIPSDGEEDRFREKVLGILKEKYGIEEEDFSSADLALVPAGEARESGIDGSMIAGYGHDDKASAYTSFRSFLDVGEPEDTVIVLFFDKEEIGSQGIAGSQSNFVEYAVSLILQKLYGKYDHFQFISLLRRSKVISSDVTAAMDPSFKGAHDTHNAGRFGSGIVIEKYSGHGGKYGGSEATAEFVAYLRGIFQKYAVPYQFGTLGKVDEGGGGTVAQDFARYGMNVVDAGAPVLGLHAPYELVSKADLWSCYRAYLAFMKH